jgi:hypothetical protein
MKELMQLIKDCWNECKYNRMPTGKNWITVDPINDGSADCLNIVIAKEIDPTGYPLNPISFITLLYEADIVIDEAFEEICKYIYEEATK